MGNGSSIEPVRCVFLDFDGRKEKIVFSRRCSVRDITDLLTQVAGVNRFSEVTLKGSDGRVVALSPSMPINTPETPYSVITKEPRPVNNTMNEDDADDDDTASINTTLTQVVDHFNRAFHVEELHTSLQQRLEILEKKFAIEEQKMADLERCRKDIEDIRNQIQRSQTKPIDAKRPSSLSDEVKVAAKRDVLSYPKYTLSKETADYLKQPTFDMWHWEPNEMLSLLEHMYHELNIIKEFNMNPITLKRWLLCVQENYRNNPFHNFRHCFCVSQMMYGFVHLCELTKKLTREDIGILLTACICHDIDHPGYNNAYQINAKTELAQRYNNQSPLENHHAAITFQILDIPEMNIFANVSHNKQQYIRDQIKMLLLATDMARHSEILEQFKNCIDKFDYRNTEHLDILKMVLVKCCDISNELRPMEVAEPWLDCLLEEYFNQSDREKEEGLPVAPFMDRDHVTKPTAQIGFIKFVLLPMFESIAKLFPQLTDVMVQPLLDALKRYERMKKEHENAAAKLK